MKTVRDLVFDYLAGHPRATAEECSRVLMISTVAAKKWILEYKEISSKPKKTKQQMVEEYISNNPSATLVQCCNDLGLAYRTVKKYRDAYYSVHGNPSDAEYIKVEQYMKQNPNASITQCSNELGISYHFAQKWITKYYDDNGITSPHSHDKSYQVSEYIKSHPDATVAECAEAVGCSIATVHKGLEFHYERRLIAKKLYILLHSANCYTMCFRRKNNNFDEARYLRHMLENIFQVEVHMTSPRDLEIWYHDSQLPQIEHGIQVLRKSWELVYSLDLWNATNESNKETKSLFVHK